MYDYITVTDVLGRMLGRVRADGLVEPAEGCSAFQMAVAHADVLLDARPDRLLRPGDRLTLTLMEGQSDPVAVMVDGTIVLPRRPPGTADTLAFWRELDRRLARVWTWPRRELV